MKAIVSGFYRTITHEKITRWTKVVAVTGSTQALVQAVTLISGILIVRILPTSDYALYTLANTMLGTLVLVADGGITNGVMSQGGLIWQDKKQLGVVLKTGLLIRGRLGWLSLLVAIPILTYLLLSHHAGIVTTILILLAIIPAFYASLTDSLLEIIPRLHQDINALQKNQLTVSLVRLLLTCAVLFTFPFSFLIILAGGIPRIFGNISLRKIAYKNADRDVGTSSEVHTKIIRIVKRTLPGTIYYSLSSQITIWLISFFGNSNSVAEIGALGRVSMILNLFGVLFGTLVVPRYARLGEDKQILFKRFLQIFFGSLAICVLIILGVWMFSPQILYVLGKNYATLDKELILNMTGSCITLLSAVAFSLYSSKGWAMHPALLISLDLISIVCGILIFDVFTLTGVLQYNIFTSSCLLLINFTFMTYKLMKSR